MVLGRMGECRKMSDQCGDFDDIDSVGDEPLEVFDIAGGDGLAGTKSGGSDHAIGMRAALASGFMKQTGGEFRLVLGEGMNAAAKNRMNGILLFLGMRTIAKLRPSNGRRCEWDLIF